MHYRKLVGFSVAEMLASLAIVVILALATIFELNSYQKGEELRTAARQLAGDIRSVQSSAFSARNIKACPLGAGKAICEESEAMCAPGTCVLTIPQSYGISFNLNSSNYEMFADLNPIVADYKLTDQNELLARRFISALGGQNVIVDSILVNNVPGSTRADITFLRQSGDVAFVTAPVAPGATVITIKLRHLTTGATQSIEINKATGRISIL